MQIVINICKEDFDDWCMQARMVKDLGSMQGRIRDAIFHSTPLPKVHGRLIDADAIYGQISKMIDSTPTIIEADAPKKRKGTPLKENDSGYNCENWIP